MVNITTTEEFFSAVRGSLEAIGYPHELVQRNYPFPDFLVDREPLRSIDMAAFAQQPTSYRSACFGFIVAQFDRAETIELYRALGAPHIFSYIPDENTVRLWRNVAEGPPTFVDNFAPESLPHVIRDRQERWNPIDMLRAKSIGLAREPSQLDLFDLGLLPSLEEVVHTKLDDLLRRVIASCRDLDAQLHEYPLNYRSLYRLIFRLMAAKLLHDRHQIGPWNASNVQEVLAAINTYYYTETLPDPIVVDERVQQLAWDEMRQSFSFQNLSVEAIAYVYENTFVDIEARKTLDIHATSPAIAEYIVHQLPFDDLDLSQCRIFEPFAGHAPFLVAALGRLRTLLPPNSSSEVRHEYFTRSLSGMEIDPFAREAAFNTLRLADFPNPNGWKIYEGDIFASRDIDTYLASANIVLCNPPYSNFTKEEKSKYIFIETANKAVEALQIVLRSKPDMIGFVLPRIFLSGRGYRGARQRIAELYDQISVVSLPDVAFSHSEAETVLLMAHGKRTSSPKWISSYVAPNDYQIFTRTGEPTWQVHAPVKFTKDTNDPLFQFSPLLRELEEHAEQLSRLEDFAVIHRGIEYVDHVAKHVAQEARHGFEPGLHTVDQSLSPYEIRNVVYLDTNPRVLRGNAYKKYPWDESKVVANPARLSKGPWTIEAAVDEAGLICYQSLFGIWPKGDFPLEVIAAILNGPVANIYINLTRISAPHNQKRQVEQIPVPKFTPLNLRTIVSLVREYRSLGELMRAEPARAMEYQEQRQAISLRIDSEVWAAYKLPVSLAQSILEYFKGYKHPATERELHIDVERSLEDLQVRPEVANIADRLLKEKAELWAELSKY